MRFGICEISWMFPKILRIRRELLVRPVFGAGAAIAFAEACQIERAHSEVTLPLWLFSRRNAILALLLFALAGAWTGYLIAVLIYAAISFFFVQYLTHRLRSELTPH